MKNQRNGFVAFRTSNDDRLQQIATKMNTTTSAILRQLVDIFVADPFALVMHDLVINSKSEAANNYYFLYRVNLNALKEIDSDALSDDVRNGLIDFISILSKATGDETINKINEIKIQAATSHKAAANQ